MIPISDRIPSSRQPICVYFLIGINIAFFLWELKLETNGQLGDVISRWSLVPAKIITVAAEASITGNPATWVALIFLSTSLLSAMFLHGSFSQILGNLLFLWVFGKNVESKLGHQRFLAFYLSCGVLTSVGQILAEPTLKLPLIGANGAIASILGAYLVSFPRAKIDTLIPLLIVFIPIELPALFYLFWWFVQQAFYSISSLNIPGGVNLFSVAYWAHGFGLIIGGVAIRFLTPK